MRKSSDKPNVPKFLQQSKPRHLNRPKISPEEIVRREKAGESLKSIAKSVGISLDRIRGSPIESGIGPCRHAVTVRRQ
jgi:hypothetical protein